MTPPTRHAVALLGALALPGCAPHPGLDAPFDKGAHTALARTPSPMRFLPIPAGTFPMGSPPNEPGRRDDEGPVHAVTLSAFWMGETEVTQAQWRAVMDADTHVEEYDGESLSGDTLPVQGVTWFEAVAYANALSAREGLRPAYTVDGDDVTWDRTAEGYRLPTEAEWEYAARAGTTTIWPGTSDDAELCALGNVADQSVRARFTWAWPTATCDDGVPGLAPVKRYRPNAWGLYDTTGNVWEWCWDRYASGAYTTSPAQDPAGPASGDSRVNRGGSWCNWPIGTRVADRNWFSPSNNGAILGFRLVRSAAP